MHPVISPRRARRRVLWVQEHVCPASPEVIKGKLGYACFNPFMLAQEVTLDAAR